MLFSPNHNRKPGPKGPSTELVHAVVEMKQRNPRWGCPRISEQITLPFPSTLQSNDAEAHIDWFTTPATFAWQGAGEGTFM
jgi:hypothetical protein